MAEALVKITDKGIKYLDTLDHIYYVINKRLVATGALRERLEDLRVVSSMPWPGKFTIYI